MENGLKDGWNVLRGVLRGRGEAKYRLERQRALWKRKRGSVGKRG